MAKVFTENWDNFNNWNLTSGNYTISSNTIIPGTSGFNINTSSKISISGNGGLLIEFSNNQNDNYDINFALVDVNNSSNFIGFYCSENYYYQGIRIDFSGVFGNGYTNTGTTANGRMYYQIEINGTSVTIRRGSSYGNYTTTLNRTLSTSINSYNFYLRISNEKSNHIFYPITIDNLITGSSKFFQLF
jgi:hypothetical protein